MTRYLLDTSAFWQGRLNRSAATRIADLSANGQIVVCMPVLLEILVGARNLQEWIRMRASLASVPQAELTDPMAAVELHGLLAQRGQHRTPVVDVIVAATAAEHGLTILHYDRDFDRLAKLTGGGQEWVVAAGTGHR